MIMKKIYIIEEQPLRLQGKIIPQFHVRDGSFTGELLKLAFSEKEAEDFVHDLFYTDPAVVLTLKKLKYERV